MECTYLGASGLQVSRLAFGAMSFGDADYHGFRSEVDLAGADRLVGAALEAGINVFDTADIYAGGESETILGQVLAKSGRRDRVVLATKVGHPMGEDPNDAGLSARHVIAGCEASLRRLGTDWIDLYQCHTADLGVPLEETLMALDDLVRRGLIRYLGWSNWPGYLAAEARTLQRDRGWAPFVAAQVYYSLVGREVEHEILPLARRSGLGTLIWSPLAGGFLTGKYTRDNPDGGSGRRASFDFPPVDLDRGYQITELLARIATAHNAQPAQVALAWLLGRDAVSSVLIGAKTPEQLNDNLAAADLSLTDDEFAALDDASAIPTPYPWHRHRGIDFAAAGRR